MLWRLIGKFCCKFWKIFETEKIVLGKMIKNSNFFNNVLIFVEKIYNYINV